MKKIMVVDDEDVTVKMLNYLLRKNGFNVVSFQNGKEALDAVESERPDLILMDVMMPVMTGIEASRLIKSDSRFSGIPIIILSALGQEIEVSEGLDGGADEYVIKPFDSNALVRLINSKLK